MVAKDDIMIHETRIIIQRDGAIWLLGTCQNQKLIYEIKILKQRNYATAPLPKGYDFIFIKELPQHGK